MGDELTDDGCSSAGGEQTGSVRYMSPELVRTVLYAVQNEVCAIDLDFNVTYVSDEMLKVFGLPARQFVIGRKCYEVVKGRRDLCPNCAVAEMYRTASPARMISSQADMELTGGRAYEVVAHPIRDDDGNIIGAAEFIQDVTERIRSAEALRQAHLRLVNAREEERMRLAGELHDSIGQGLIAMQLAIAAAVEGGRRQDPARQIARLTAAAMRCAELLNEVRDISHGLYPPTLASLGVASALRELARHYTPAVQFTLQCPKELADVRFSPQCEIAMFRIAQEAISNAIRHGQASGISLDLHYRGDHICLSVADDGCGFDPAEISEGMGMRTMRERTLAVKGALEVSSRPGCTTVSVSMPPQ